MSIESKAPEVGEMVAVRQRLYLVDSVISPPNPYDSLLVQLSCVDDDAQGQPVEVLWDHELDAQVVTGEAWDEIAPNTGKAEQAQAWKKKLEALDADEEAKAVQTKKAPE